MQLNTLPLNSSDHKLQQRIEQQTKGATKKREEAGWQGAGGDVRKAIRGVHGT